MADFKISESIMNLLSSTSFKPYLIRAFHEYASEIGETPLITVDCTVPGVDVPVAWIKDNKITLNISWSATSQLFIGENEIKFRANFGQNQIQCVVPMYAVLVIFCRESNFQIPFIRVLAKEDSVATAKVPEEKPLTFPNKPIYPPRPQPKKKDRSHLRVIK